MATLEEIKKQKSIELERRIKEEEDRIMSESNDHHTIRSFFEQELEREIKKTGFYKRLMYLSPLLVVICMMLAGSAYIYFKDVLTIRDANAEAYAIEAIGKATASAVTQVGTALKLNPEYTVLTTAQKWNGILPNTMVSGQNPPFINTKP